MPTRKRITLQIMAAVTAFAVGTPDASAQNIFDMLFGGKRVRPQVEREFPPEPAAPKPVVIPKVAGPSYYTYKPEALSKVDFASVVAAEALPSDPHARPGSSFADARSVLATLDLFAEKDIADAMAAHYAAKPEFIWISGYHPNALAAEARLVLAEADDWGLDPADYAVAEPAQRFSLDDVPARMAELMRYEMALTARVLRYARDAHGGRIDPNKISGYHDFELKRLNLEGALTTLANSGAARSFLEMRHPSNREFAALKAELASLRRQVGEEIVVDPRTLVRPGGSHAEFPKITLLISRQADEAFTTEFGAVMEAHRGSEHYAEELVPAVKAVQKARGLQPDGIIGPRTVAVISGDSKADRLAKVKVAMEQIRWLPSDFGDRYVYLNTPSFTATYHEAGEEKLSMRAIYGTTGTQTYFFKDRISYVEFHPYWGMPRSILVNKYLNRLIQDPSYLDRNGFEVTNAKGQKIPSSSIDWSQYGSRVPYDVRQRPGSGNALGELKIMFPNKHAIYMHDTPDRQLFSRDNRALSNGCIRLQDPRGMAAAVLGWSVDEVSDRLKKPHSRENLSGEVPVYVAYFTAWPQADGKVEYYPDVYSRDPRIATALEKTSDLRGSGS